MANERPILWINTRRLRLRPYVLADLDSVHRFLGDPDTMNFYPLPYTREKVASVIERNQKTWEESQFGLMVVIEKLSNEVVGDCGITVQTIDGVNEFEVGYRFAKEFWGKGFGGEVASAVIQYGFQTLGLRRLCSYMPASHRQSRRVAEKVGMTLEKTFRNTNNGNVLTSVYSMTAS